MTDYLDRREDVDDPEVASTFDETSFWSSRFGALLFTHVALERNVRGLDLGCGTGFPLLELAQVHGPTCRFVGVDVWAEALRRAEHKRRARRLANVALVRADAARLPFRDECFDLVASSLGVNNFADPKAALAECRRVAAPRARLVITTNVRGHMRELYDVFRETLVEIGKRDRLDRLAENEDHRATPKSLGALVQAAGFQLTRAIEQSFALRFLDGSALLRHSLVRIGFLDGWRRVVDPPDERLLFEALESKLDALAAREGELRTTIPTLYLEARRL